VQKYAMLVRTPAFDPKTHDVMAEHVAADAKSAAHATPQHALNGKEHGGPAERADSSGTNLLSPQFPAPAAVIWYSVARVLAKGFKQLPPWSGLGMLIGGVLGIIIALLEEFLPKRFVKWIPSATGLGLGGVIYPPASIAMFFGSLIGAVWLKAHARSCNQYLIAGASGLIAGESLTGVGCNLAGIIWDSVCSLFGG
jgi:MFS family permease